MRTFGKVLGVIGIVLLVLVVAGVTFAAWTVHRSYPQTTGTVTLQGLEGDVDVYRNDRGIPDLYADTPADLFFAQGYVHAQDRFWEMDFRRHITAAGKPTTLSFEGAAISGLKRVGWMKDTVKAGEVVTVVGHPYKDGRPGGSIDHLLLADGRKVGTGDAIPSALIVPGVSAQ